MAHPSLSVSSRRHNPFGRSSASPSPVPQSVPNRPKSVAFTSPVAAEPAGHTRTSSVSLLGSGTLLPSNARARSNSTRNNTPTSNTFAPKFIKTEEVRRGADQIRGIEGDNDFSGKRYVWLRDAEKAFVRGLVIEERDSGYLLVQYDDGSVSTWPDNVIWINCWNSHV